MITVAWIIFYLILKVFTDTCGYYYCGESRDEMFESDMYEVLYSPVLEMKIY